MIMLHALNYLVHSPWCFLYIKVFISDNSNLKFKNNQKHGMLFLLIFTNYKELVTELINPKR